MMSRDKFSELLEGMDALQNWKQGLAKPNRQAALLIRIVRKSRQVLSLLNAMN